MPFMNMTGLTLLVHGLFSFDAAVLLPEFSGDAWRAGNVVFLFGHVAALVGSCVILCSSDLCYSYLSYFVPVLASLVVTSHHSPFCFGDSLFLASIKF